MKFIDFHCDTLCEAVANRAATMKDLPNCMVDIKRMKAGGQSAQFFAMYLMPEDSKDGAEWFGWEKMPPTDEFIQILHTVFLNTMKENSELIAPAYNYQDYLKNEKNGKMSAFLTIEDGFAAFGKMERLEKFYDLGVRLISLTWNFENCFGFPNSKDPEIMKKGLTDFGKEAVAYMNEKGMIIDVSHLSDGGFYDVANLTKTPFVASHSNCRAICPHTRNLTDDMIRILGEKGGMAGINYGPDFLNKDPLDRTSRIDTMCDHILHMINIGGEDCVGLGSDFDGIGGTLEIPDCAHVQPLFDTLHTRGLTWTQIEKIAFGNALRVIRESMR